MLTNGTTIMGLLKKAISKSEHSTHFFIGSRCKQIIIICLLFSSGLTAQSQLDTSNLIRVYTKETFITNNTSLIVAYKTQDSSILYSFYKIENKGIYGVSTELYGDSSCFVPICFYTSADTSFFYKTSCNFTEHTPYFKTDVNVWEKWLGDYLIIDYYGAYSDIDDYGTNIHRRLVFNARFELVFASFEEKSLLHFQW